MTTGSVTGRGSAHAWRERGATGWLALAASPTFTLMAWVAARNTSSMPLCAAARDILPVNGMTSMHLLMGLFHLSPWLKLASGRARARI